MAAILGDSTVVVVVRTRPRAIPLAMITMRKSTHGFPFVSHMSMGLRLAAPRAAGAPLIYIGCLVTLRTYVCSSVLTYANTLENKKSSTISIAVFLILGIHDIVH